MNWNNLSLRTKLLGVTTLAVALMFSMTLGIITFQSYKSTREQGETIAHDAALAAAAEVGAHLNNAMAAAKNATLMLEGLNNTGVHSRSAVNAMLRRGLEGQPALLALYTGWEPNAFDGEDAKYADKDGHDATGRFLPYWNRGNGSIAVEPLVDYTKPEAGDYYLLPRQSRKAHLIDPYLYPIGGKQVLITSLVQPILKDGKFQGIAGVDLALDKLQQQLDSIRPLAQGHVALITASGKLVSHPDAKLLGQAAELPSDALSALKEGRGLRWQDAQGNVNFLEPTKVIDIDLSWSTIVTVPASAITAVADRLKWTAFALGTCSVLLTAITLFVLLSALTRPINQLASAMADLSSGDADLTRRVAVERQDELGRAASALNAFLERLQVMFRDVRERSIDLHGGLRSVTHSTTQVAQTSQQLASAASENAATIEQITVSISHIADHAEEVDQTMLETSELSHRSARAVGEMESAMRNIGNTIEGLSSALMDLSHRSDQVSGIVSVIKDIADQTNLLALNAAIEAARAGEQGRGFAVVADEVRKLAERTSLATEEIRDTIETIRSDTEQAVHGMTNTQLVVKTGMESAAGVAAEIQSIEKGIGIAAQRVREIADATREQSSATTALARSIEETTTLVQTTDDAIQQASATIASLGATSDHVGELVRRFKL